VVTSPKPFGGSTPFPRQSIVGLVPHDRNQLADASNDERYDDPELGRTAA
jgi:hypothetical protein